VASVFAVVSKKIFESDVRVGGKVLGLGGVWPTEKYASTHAALKPLKDGGHLFLVTVRPPNEALWLIAVLRDVESVKDGWKAKANTTPITDITSLKSKIKFATGSGITAAKGKLGMSLQTPRALTDADVKLLLGGAPGAPAGPAGAGAPAGAAPAPAAPGKIYHLNAHATDVLPCLCMKCLEKSGERVVVDGEAFVRREARAKGRVLYYWLPEAILTGEKSVRIAIERRMKVQLADVIVHSGAKRSDDDDDGEDDE
jgi:hypothetical protein